MAGKSAGTGWAQLAPAARIAEHKYSSFLAMASCSKIEVCMVWQMHAKTSSGSSAPAQSRAGS